MTRRLAWVGVAALAIYLMLIGGGWAGIYISSVRVVTVAMTAVLLGGWAIAAARDPTWRPRSLLIGPILLCLGSLGISTIFSREPRVSLEYLGYGILLATLYLLLVRFLANDFFGPRLVRLTGVLFAVLAVVYVAVVASLWMHWWRDVGFIAPPPLRPYFEALSYGNPSAVLTVVALLAVPMTALVASWRRQRLAAWAAIAAVVGLVALLSGSRAGWFAIGMTGIIALVAFFWSAERRTVFLERVLGSARSSSPVRRASIVAAAIAALVLTTAVGPAIVARLSSGGAELRAEYAVVAMRAFASSPIVGTGPGTWVIGRLELTGADEPDYYVPHAHDVPVQVLAELGIVGAIAGTVLVLSILRLLRRAWRSPDKGLRRWVWPTTLGLLYLAFHDLLDFYPNMPAVLFAAALPVAYLDAGLQKHDAAPVATTSPIPRALWGWTKAGAALAVVLAVAGLLVQEVPAASADRAIDAANGGRWDDALAPAREAALQDPAISPYQLLAGLAEAHAGDHHAAAMAFQRVATQDDLPEAWLNLAAEQVALGQRDAAIGSLQRALRLGTQRSIIAMAAGDLALRLGETDTAREAFARALAAWPSLAGDPWWHADPDRSALFPSAFTRAIVLVGQASRWELDLAAGNSLTRDETSVSSRPDLVPIIAAAWTGDPTQTTALMTFCKAHPADVTAVLWCARVAWRQGDQGLAARFRSVAEGEAPASTGVTFELRVDEHPRSDQVLGGDPAVFWAEFTYRRASPFDVLVPSLVHLTYR